MGVTSLVWFRDDLRLADHPALVAAANDAEGMIALYILDEESDGIRPLGGAAKWWLHHSLSALRRDLASRGISLVLRRGAAARVVREVVQQSGASRVVWNRRYGAERAVDRQIKAELHEAGIEATSFVGNVLFEPWTVTTGAGTPYRVYSPFWRACVAGPPPAAPLSVPSVLRAAPHQPETERLEDWRLLPTAPNWAFEFEQRWQVGEAAANEKLSRFLEDRAAEYAVGRDIASLNATSDLSPHLRWGEISPRTVWWEGTQAAVDTGTFLSELGWREFALHTLYHHPDMASRGLNRKFDVFPWGRPDPREFAAWQRGETGFPLVDAGMRELWRTGYMHNRVRMVTASFLTKNLLVDWRVGEAWFWDTLVDADAASNPFNWQWVAGCGLDAAPYFRIFNPVTQQQKADPEGAYVQRWAPDSLLHPPLVDLQASRQRALAAYEHVKAG